MSLTIFDKYRGYTDIAALKEWSQKPLRKSIRVNTLKTTVSFVQEWAKEHGWHLEQVPWCKEGFFVDRENREHALGKDLLHLLGHIYLQEAASMLPVALLDPQPGDAVLDMSAAPGSKTTQIASALQGSGVIVANDVQEKRLWTLKTALHRSGVHNVIVTKKMGQWFGKNMTERFDRVLCDAPCTAQGTLRKDPTALEYCSADNIGKMARLQRELLEAAVHAAKVGGRIVYSTCTLTPEENEEVVLSILNKYCDQVEAVDMREWGIGNGGLEEAARDSETVQSKMKKPQSSARFPIPSLRLWPQTYDTEGFFCAVLQKKAPTRPWERTETVFFQEQPLKRNEKEKYAVFVRSEFGTDFLNEGDRLFRRADQLVLSTDTVSDFSLPVQDYALGMPYAKGLKDGRVRLISDLVMFRGAQAQKNVWDIDDTICESILKGEDVSCPDTFQGDTVLRWRGMALGMGVANSGRMKNRLSRWLVSHFVR